MAYGTGRARTFPTKKKRRRRPPPCLSTLVRVILDTKARSLNDSPHGPLEKGASKEVCFSYIFFNHVIDLSYFVCTQFVAKNITYVSKSHLLIKDFNSFEYFNITCSLYPPTNRKYKTQSYYLLLLPHLTSPYISLKMLVILTW